MFLRHVDQGTDADLLQPIPDFVVILSRGIFRRPSVEHGDGRVSFQNGPHCGDDAHPLVVGWAGRDVSEDFGNIS